MRPIAALQDKRDLSRMLGSTVRVDVDPLSNPNFNTSNIFGLYRTQALDTPTITVPYVLQGGLSLPDRDYYLSTEPEMVEIRIGYRAYIAKILALSGFVDAAPRAARVVALEAKIAQVQATLVDSQDVHKVDNPWTRSDFAAKAPGSTGTRSGRRRGCRTRRSSSRGSLSQSPACPDWWRARRCRCGRTGYASTERAKCRRRCRSVRRRDLRLHQDDDRRAGAAPARQACDRRVQRRARRCGRAVVKPAPVIDGLTGDQRLFLAFAQVWQQKARDRMLRAGIASDGHAPRVTAPKRYATSMRGTQRLG